jgi:hypothetical protein
VFLGDGTGSIMENILLVVREAQRSTESIKGVFSRWPPVVYPVQKSEDTTAWVFMGR